MAWETDLHGNKGEDVALAEFSELPVPVFPYICDSLCSLLSQL